MKIRNALAVLAVSLFAIVGFTPASFAATAEVGVLADTYTPAVLSETGDTAKVELGLKFSPTTDGRIKGIQFYQNAANSGVTSVSLWGNGGTRLIKITIPATGPVGWRTIPVDRALVAGRTYTVSVSDTNGRYPYSPQYFTSARTINGISVGANAGVYRYGAKSEFPSQSWNGSNYLVDLVYATTAPAPDPAPVPEPTPEPTPVEPPPTSSTPTSYNYLGRSFPDASSVGVPAGVTLTPYTGPCTIQVAGTVIDGKEVRCDDFRIFAHGVVIKNSLFHNRVYVDDGAHEGSFTITDSEVRSAAATGTGIGDADFVATRVKVTGGNRGIACYRDCTVQDSYVLGGYTDTRGLDHMSGIRVNTNSTLLRNTIGCSAPDIGDAGCSAAITGYPDFDPVSGNRIEGNLILADSGGYCTYGGSTAGKPYSGQTHDIVFRDNVWQRGDHGRGCWYGPVTSFDVAAPGNVWQNNLWVDGAPVPPAN